MNEENLLFFISDTNVNPVLLLYALTLSSFEDFISIKDLILLKFDFLFVIYGSKIKIFTVFC